MRNDNIKRSIQAIYDGAGGGRGDHSVLHTFGCVDFANQTRLQTGEPLHDVDWYGALARLEWGGCFDLARYFRLGSTLSALKFIAQLRF